MKKLILTLLVACSTVALAQQKIPSVSVKSMDGKTVDASTINNDGKPMVISFWATWCKPCVRELNAINDMYVDWQEETGVKIVAISIDDSRNSARVKPFVTSKGWDYPIYLDPNSELRRAMNVNNIPHTFLINGDGEVVWEHNGYMPGDEDHLYELITKLANGESIEE